MGKKAPQSTTTKTTFEMSPEQRALIQPTIPIFENYLKNPPKPLDYSQVAGFDPLQTKAQETILGAAGSVGRAGQAANRSNQFLMDPRILDPSSNKYLQGSIDAATRPITENLLEKVLPGLRGEAMASGQLGGSRRAIAETGAVREAARAVGDVGSTMANQNYQSGLDAMSKAIALNPQVMQGLQLPGLMQGAVGDQRQKMEQALLAERASKDIFRQMAPFLAASEVARIGTGLPGGTNVSTAQLPQASPWASGLSGAMGGAALGASIPGIGPWGAIPGAGIGALMSLL